MELDPVLLSRLQFAWVIAWHILLPAFTVGLASFIAVLEGLRLCDRTRGLCPHLDVLDQDLFDRIRHGRGHRHCHAVPDRNELEPLLGCDRECAVAAVRLRGPDRLLPRGGVSGRSAVRPQAGAALGLFRLCAHGRDGHFVLVLLDPGGQQLDADAGRLRDRQRPILFEGLARGDLQPVLPLPVGARRRRLLRYHRFRRARRRRLSRSARADCRRRTDRCCR